MSKFRTLTAALAAALSVSAPAMAQSNPGWFVPQQGAAPAGKKVAAPAKAPVHSAPSVPAPVPAQPDAQDAQAAPPIPLPPVPELPPLPKAGAPPTVAIGVLSVPDVMRESVAAQAVEKIIGERRDRLNQDAQKEQSILRDMQQSYANERAKLSADQQHNREKEMQDRLSSAQKKLRERGQVIQQAAQYALSQIERTLIAVIRQVSESHGMNLVLHRAQVALNVNDFDITKEVSSQLNLVLPAVAVPPDGMTVAQFVAQQTGKPGGQDAPPPPVVVKKSDGTIAPAQATKATVKPDAVPADTQPASAAH